MAGIGIDIILVLVGSTKDFGGNSLRFGGKPFFLKMGAEPLKKGAMTPLLRKKGVPAKTIIPKYTDQVFLWYWFGKYREIPTEYLPKIPNRYDSTLYDMMKTKVS